MKKVIVPLAFALAWPAAASAQEVKALLSGPDYADVGSPILLNPTGSFAPGGLEFGLAQGPGPAPVVSFTADDGKSKIGMGTAAAPGTYVFFVIAWGTPPEKVEKGKGWTKSFAFKTVQVGKTPPPPPPDPGPGPGPGPGPTPGPSPFPGDGFRVLIVYDQAKLASYPASQRQALQGEALRGYLQAKTVKGADGDPGYRIWYDGIDASAAPQVWQDAMKRPRAQTPWVVIGTGKAGFEGPLPATEAEIMALLAKYGG